MTDVNDMTTASLAREDKATFGEQAATASSRILSIGHHEGGYAVMVKFEVKELRAG